MFQRPPSVGRAMMPGTPQYGQPLTPSAAVGGTMPLQHVTTTTKTPYLMGAAGPFTGASYPTASTAFTTPQHAHPLNRPAPHFGMS